MRQGRAQQHLVVVGKIALPSLLILDSLLLPVVLDDGWIILPALAAVLGASPPLAFGPTATSSPMAVFSNYKTGETAVVLFRR